MCGDLSLRHSPSCIVSSMESGEQALGSVRGIATGSIFSLTNLVNYLQYRRTTH